MLECQNSFRQQLQDIIKFNIENNISSSLLAVEIKNISTLVTMYDQDFVSEALQNLGKDIYKALTGIQNHIDQNNKKEELLININKEFIYIFIPNISNHLSSYIDTLYSEIQLFSGNNDLKPIHFVSRISSVDIPLDSHDATDAINKSYIVLKNDKSFAYSQYYTSYREFISNKESFTKDLILTTCLKKALLEKKLRLAFQPIVESKTGQVTHYESLLRIINTKGEIVSAGPFIEKAEESGFISFIDEAVLEMVAKELKEDPNIHLAFNVSALGIYNKNWLKKTKDLLHDPNLASRTIVEITETAAQKDLRKTAYFVATLQDIGCQVALDDFGSGYTSFRQLKALPVDIIKIDGTYIKDILDHSDNLLLVKTLLNVIHGFGLKSVAEFVENGEIAKLLIDLNVDYMQGNYFYPAVNYRTWVKETETDSNSITE